MRVTTLWMENGSKRSVDATNVVGVREKDPSNSYRHYRIGCKYDDLSPFSSGMTAELVCSDEQRTEVATIPVEVYKTKAWRNMVWWETEVHALLGDFEDVLDAQDEVSV